MNVLVLILRFSGLTIDADSMQKSNTMRDSFCVDSSEGHRCHVVLDICCLV
jgi:hypothetical protein